MKRWIKWTVIALVLGLVAAGAMRALSARAGPRRSCMNPQTHIRSLPPEGDVASFGTARQEAA